MVTIEDIRHYVMDNNNYNTNMKLEEHVVIPHNYLCEKIEKINNARKVFDDNFISINEEAFNCKMNMLIHEEKYYQELNEHIRKFKLQKMHECVECTDKQSLNNGTHLNVCPWCGNMWLD